MIPERGPQTGFWGNHGCGNHCCANLPNIKGQTKYAEGNFCRLFGPTWGYLGYLGKSRHV